MHFSAFFYVCRVPVAREGGYISGSFWKQESFLVVKCQESHTQNNHGTVPVSLPEI